jgi:hypothetical protein
VADATKDGSETGSSMEQALHFKRLGLNLHDTMIWQKTPLPMNHNRYEQVWEYMFVLCDGTPKVFNGKREACRNFGRGFPGGSTRQGGNDAREHNTQNAVGRWLWNNALAPALRAMINGFAWVAEGVAGFLDALSNIPGFGWAKVAAEGLRGIARTARDAANGIRDIPDPKVKTGKSQQEIATLKARIASLKGKVVEAKAKGDTREVKRLQAEIAKVKSKLVRITAEAVIRIKTYSQQGRARHQVQRDDLRLEVSTQSAPRLAHPKLRRDFPVITHQMFRALVIA